MKDMSESNVCLPGCLFVRLSVCQVVCLSGCLFVRLITSLLFESVR